MERPEPERHQATVTAETQDEKIRLIIDCSICGRVVLGPFPAGHLSTIRDVAEDLIPKMGIEVIHRSLQELPDRVREGSIEDPVPTKAEETWRKWGR